MSDQKKRLEEGPPIWVESCLSPQEYRDAAKKYNTFNSNSIVSFNPTYHKGGRWRFEMGDVCTPEQIKTINDRIDTLRKLVIKERVEVVMD